MAPLLVLVLAASAQAGPVDPTRVDEAVRKGVAWLKGGVAGADEDLRRTDELVLLALAHGGVAAEDGAFQARLKRVLDGRLTATYNVALQAMVLEEIQRVIHQDRIWMCAQFLVDNQGPEGQWSYGREVDLGTPTAAGPRAVPTQPFPRQGKVVIFGVRGGGSDKPPVVRRLKVAKRRDGPDRGDNSNAQYAALGMRACHDAGIELPEVVVKRARDWWLRSIRRDGAEGGTVTGTPPGGWGYTPGDSPYGSMTAGGLGALVICEYILGRDGKRERAAQAAAAWLGVHFTVADNPKARGRHHYYYLYGLERSGMLYETKRFGARDWYAEGAAYLLANQQADGSWRGFVDTCFAILFLKKATRPLVATPGR